MSQRIENDEINASIITRPFDTVSEAELDLIASQFDEILADMFRRLNEEE